MIYEIYSIKMIKFEFNVTKLLILFSFVYNNT